MLTRLLTHATCAIFLSVLGMESLASAQASPRDEAQPLVDPFAESTRRTRSTPQDLVPWDGRELSARDRQLARELFQAGVEATQSSNWAAALDAFGRVYALTHRAEVLLNLATAQAQTGALLNAIESYRRFLTSATPALQEQHGEQARAALAQVEARIPRLRIDASGGSGTLVVLDGTALSSAELGVPLPLDPGTHTVVLREGDNLLDQESITLSEGESRTVTLEREAPTVTPRESGVTTGETQVAPPPRQDVSQTDSDVGMIGLGVAVGVVVVAGIVVAIVFAAQPSEDPGYTGSLGRVTSDVNQPFMGTLATWDAF